MDFVLDFTMCSADLIAWTDPRSMCKCYAKCFKDKLMGFSTKIFEKMISLSILLSLLIHNIILKYDHETYESKLHLWFKVARYSFSRPIPPKFEHKLRRHKQSFGKIATTVVLDKDENLLWSGL